MRTQMNPPAAPISRAEAAVASSPGWSRFLLSKPNYAPQYAQLYFCRLMNLLPTVEKRASERWGPASDELRYASSILNAAATPDIDSAVAGVIFRDMPNKPSILAEYGKASNTLIPAPPTRGSQPYTSTDPSVDRVILEDQTGRFALDVSDVADQFLKLTTGFIVTVRGHEDKTTGAFKVADFVTVGCAPQPPVRDLSEDRYICIVSGLSLGDAQGDAQFNASLSSELLLEYLRGNLGGEEQAAQCASIAHLIIAGNSVALSSGENGRTRDMTSFLKKAKPSPIGEEPPHHSSATPMAYADRFFTAAAASMPVSVMPGEEDPANFLMPQQPLHRCLLPNASRQANLERVTNPFEQTFDDRLVLGTSGQNVTDYVMYSPAAVVREEMASAAATLDAMEAMVHGRHVAPTAPDTLGSYPFTESDPFVVEKTPHIFFSGNQAEYGTRVMDIGDQANVRLLSVPRFDRTGVAVLVNLRTLDVSLISVHGALQ